ncbi:MAG: phosphatidylserine decarboxylase family protein [Desulfovibrio sp.]|jgi:phosphatidylserine decarboxylase|nr:phosphatidylserine decarboxylase family protein [Desulfovibrio sp.]
MRPSSIAIAPEGYPFIAATCVATLTFALLEWEWAALLCLACFAFCIQFFRDPERVAPRSSDVAVSPADGRVLPLTTRQDPFTGESRTCISVFMNVFNVHVNRVPVNGTVEDIRYWPGKFFNASLDKASTDNERCAIQMRDDDGKAWTVVQIAGLVARRIVCRATEGDVLRRGDRYGMIRFGSRVDLYLPRDYVPVVREGDRTTAGMTILARRGTSTPS